VKRSLTAIRAAVVALVVLPIRAYRTLISPALPRRCKYEPTCSAYAEQAVRELGVIRGLVVAAWRVVRCNPWSHGGYDPVEAQTVFRARTPRDADPPPTAHRTSGGLT
jgi:uncharacterized protein